MGTVKEEFKAKVTDVNGKEWGRICEGCSDKLKVRDSVEDAGSIGKCGVQGCKTFTQFKVGL